MHDLHFVTGGKVLGRYVSPGHFQESLMVKAALEMGGTESTGIQRTNELGMASGPGQESSGRDWNQERPGGTISPIQELYCSRHKNCLQGTKPFILPTPQTRALASAR